MEREITDDTCTFSNFQREMLSLSKTDSVQVVRKIWLLVDKHVVLS